jgi:hypothetical protein
VIVSSEEHFSHHIDAEHSALVGATNKVDGKSPATLSRTWSLFVVVSLHLEALPSSARSVGLPVDTIIEPPSRVAPGMAVVVVVVVVVVFVVVVVPLALHLGRWLACGHCGGLRGLRLAKLEKPAQIARRLRQFLRTMYSSGLVRQSALGSAGTNLTDVVLHLLRFFSLPAQWGRGDACCGCHLGG